MAANGVVCVPSSGCSWTALDHFIGALEGGEASRPVGHSFRILLSRAFELGNVYEELQISPQGVPGWGKRKTKRQCVNPSPATLKSQCAQHFSFACDSKSQNAIWRQRGREGILRRRGIEVKDRRTCQTGTMVQMQLTRSLPSGFAEWTARLLGERLLPVRLDAPSRRCGQGNDS